MIAMKSRLTVKEQEIERAVAGLLPVLHSLHGEIHAHPETALEERRAAGRLADFLAGEGFRVQRGIGGLATAFRADAGPRKRPRVTFIAEYDALPGLGHACGHSIIAAASVGAGAALHRAGPGLAVSVVGAPAEETGAGKVPLIRAGVFAGDDFAMMTHPSSRRRIVRLSLGVVKRQFTFLGKPAHAAAHPEEGVNALDAAVLFYTGVSALRQQRPERVKIHLVIPEGGRVLNIIPARAEVWCGIRALSLQDLAETVKRVEECGRAAAKATGARLTISRPGHLVLPLKVNRTLAAVYEDQLRKLGLEPHPGPEDRHIGSSDIGNLSWVLPVIHPHVGLGPPWDLAIHTPEFERAAGGKKGKAAVREGALLLALAAYTVLNCPALRKAVQREFRATPEKIPRELLRGSK